MSQELPDISKIPQLTKAAFTNFLYVFWEGEIRVEPHTQVPDRLGGVKGVAQDINWETCTQYELSFIGIEFKFASRHPFFYILKASIQLIKGSRGIPVWEMDIELCVVCIKMEVYTFVSTNQCAKGRCVQRK